ncbi:MAG: TonB-dependent receptor plug domain-containing protein, partial [Brevundimonas sp.]
MKVSFLRHMLTGSACALILAGAAAAQTRNFDVPSGELKGALDTYARQAGVQLVYKTEDVRGVRTRGVHEAVDAETALRRLLEGTGLTVQRDSSGALAIIRQTAQKTAWNDDQASTVEEVVVTGSRLKNVFDAATPVVSMEREALLEGGYMDLAEALTDIPGVEEGVSLANSQTATQANGLSTISLRNLGENRTLTLIDGHRTVSNAGNKNAVSLSTIPEFFVDRVEVTTGGGSAVYGSDAIAGVVNVITERRLDGVRARVVGGTTYDGGGESIEYSVGAGRRFLDDRLYVMAGATYDRQFKLKATDRERALESIVYEPADNTVSTPDRSTYTDGGRFVSSKWYYDEDGLKPNFVTAVNGYETRRAGTLITPRDNLNGAAKFDYALTDNLKIWGQALYSNVVTDSTREPTSLSSSTTFGVNDEFTVGRMSRTLNPFAPAEIKASASSSGIDFRRRMIEVGPNLIHNERETIRSWIGIEGALANDWDWKLTYGYGKFSGEQIRGNTLNLQRVKWALDSERVNGVVQC